MSLDRYLPFAPLLALLCWAAVEDLRVRRIRNWLTFSLVLSGLALSLTPARSIGPGPAALGLAAGLGLPLALFVIGAVGGGDVKLLAGIGAWVGATRVVEIFAVEAVIGMLIVLAQAIASGRLRLLARNSAVIALGFCSAGEMGLKHAVESGQSCRSVDRPLPFAVPVFAATLLVLYFSH